jgi:Protein of unknown function (DUF732).
LTTRWSASQLRNLEPTTWATNPKEGFIMLPTRGRKPRPPLPLVAAGIVAAVTGMLIASPTSHADPNQDDAFYTALEQQDVAVLNPPAVRSLGIQTCNELRSGTPNRITATKLMNMGFTRPESSALLNAAMAAYCPEMASAKGRSL